MEQSGTYEELHQVGQFHAEEGFCEHHLHFPTTTEIVSPDSTLDIC